MRGQGIAHRAEPMLGSFLPAISGTIAGLIPPETVNVQCAS